MLVKEIYEECVEGVGSCDSTLIFRTITRAVELLANKGLFDPLLGTIDFRVEGGYWLALPRDVKTPLRININSNPAVSRNRLFEFAPNSDGSADGPEVGWQWHEKGYSPIQDEVKLPSAIRYVVTDSADVGKTARIIGVDTEGREQDETIVGAQSGSVATVAEFGEIKTVIREATTKEAWLYAATGPVARYYPDEEEPSYRVIKLSETDVGVRMLYRKHVFKITSQDDIIPLHSPMAVIRAVDAVRLYQRKRYEEASAVLEEAAKMISEEQQTRDENSTIAGTVEIQTATNTNINTNGVLIVADIYDLASDILGPIGRTKIFDRITDAINALQNKTQWDSLLGEAVLTRAANFGTEPAGSRCRGDGYFALPRYIGAVLAVNTNGIPGIPRNRWFEFHLNGTGETNFASCGTWDDKAESPIINGFARLDCKITPAKLLVIPDNNLDNGKEVTIYGIERLADGTEVEVWRDGSPGWTVECDSATYVADSSAPSFVKITRIKREATVGFVRMVAYDATSQPTSASNALDHLLLGFWYPDELEPSYKVIKIAGCCTSQIRVRYRKRTNKITSIYDVINLRSRLAMENMLRALSNQSTNPQAAALYEQMAVNYLTEEQMASNPIMDGGLQFDMGSAPGYNENII